MVKNNKTTVKAKSSSLKTQVETGPALSLKDKGVKPKAAPVKKQQAKPITPKWGTKGVATLKIVPVSAAEPAPKGLYSLEFMINSSPDVLFEYISTPGGLENWFADRVYIIESNFIFNWEDGEKRMAKQVAVSEGEFARYHWLDEPGNKYFEFKIEIDDLTSEVALIISDFADNKEELEESTRLWHSQVQDLLHAIGSS